MLSIELQSIEQMRSRFDAALEQVFYPARMKAGEQKRPGQCRENVFDFEDGFRLIISMDALDGKTPELHVSASLTEEAARRWVFQEPDLEHGGFAMSPDFDGIVQEVQNKFTDLEDWKTGIQLQLVVLTKNVFHFAEFPRTTEDTIVTENV